ncbi:hypothetical protein [Conexibacter sp. SYSU D00693]|nr:hypothetical protein [Conexibacter sp. SYSU D00693]
MQDISREDLEVHIEKLEVATQADQDELLKDFLVQAWPTKTSQDS